MILRVTPIIIWLYDVELSQLPKIPFQIKPNQQITCIGSQTDFASFGTKPDDPMSDLITSALSLAMSIELVMSIPSSRKIVLQMPWAHHCFVKGHTSLVNMDGPMVTP